MGKKRPAKKKRPPSRAKAKVVNAASEDESKNRLQDLDAQAAETMYKNEKALYGKAQQQHSERLQLFNALDILYLELDAQNARDAAFTCRIERQTMIPDLDRAEVGLKDQLKALQDILNIRVQLKRSEISSISERMSEHIPDAASNALSRRLTHHSEQLMQLEKETADVDAARDRLGRVPYPKIYHDMQEEFDHLELELKELGIQPMPRAEFLSLYQDTLQGATDEFKDADDATIGEQPPASVDPKTDGKPVGFGDAIGQRLTSIFSDRVEARFRGEVAIEQQELILEEAKRKADLLRYDLEIDNQRHRVRQKQELAELAKEEEEIEQQQKKPVYVHLVAVLRLNNRQVSFIKVAVLGIFGIYLAIASITENASRQKYLVRLDARIRGIKSEIITRGLEATSDRPTKNDAAQSGTDDATKSDDPASRMDTPNSGSRSLSHLQTDWALLEAAKESTVALISIGAHNCEGTLAGIRESEELPASGDTSSRSPPGLGLLTYVLTPFGLSLDFLSNDKLLAIILVCCGTLGSLIIAIRKRLADADQRYDGIGRHLLLGFAAGFVALLAMKGGKQIFVNQVDPGVQFFNPWSAALLGIITGLFTERAYNLLLLFVDKLEERIRLVVSDAPHVSSGRAEEIPSPSPSESRTSSSDAIAPSDGTPRQE